MFAAAQHFKWEAAISELKGDEGFNRLEQSLSAAVVRQQNPNVPLKVS